MKICKVIFLLMFLTHKGFAQEIVEITGSCPLINDGAEITLVKAMPRRFSNVNDKATTISLNHRFYFKLNAGKGESFLLYANKKFTRLYLEPGKADIQILDSLLNNIKITGNVTALQYQEFVLSQIASRETKEYNAARRNYFRSLKNNDTPLTTGPLKAKVDSLIQSKYESDRKLSLSFINRHPSSYLNTYLLYNLVDNLSDSGLKAIYNKLPSALLTNTWGKELKYRIDSLFIGAKAPAFVQTDTLGQMVSSRKFKGKYLLIDFWASWCIPCRAENPNVLAAYRKYHNKGLEILAISLDKERQKWLQAVREDGLPWQQVSDLNEFENNVSKAFYVYAIPDNYLIDSHGIIIAKGLRGDELNRKLAAIFKEN